MKRFIYCVVGILGIWIASILADKAWVLVIQIRSHEEFATIGNYIVVTCDLLVALALIASSIKTIFHKEIKAIP